MSFPTQLYVTSIRRVVETGRFRSRIIFYGEQFDEAEYYIPKGVCVLREWSDSEDLTRTVLEAMMLYGTLEASQAVISLDLWESESPDPQITDEGLRRAVYVLFYPLGEAHRFYYSVDDRGRKHAAEPEQIGFLSPLWEACDEVARPELPLRVPGFLRSRGHQLVDLR